jgi:hypothetical protein
MRKNYLFSLFFILILKEQVLAISDCQKLISSNSSENKIIDEAKGNFDILTFDDKFI